MKFFIDIIAQSYLLHTKNISTEIAQFFFQQYNKVKEGSGNKTIFSKNQFYNTLMSEIDSLIKDSYASKYKNNSALEDSVLRQNYNRKKWEQDELYYEECRLFGYEYIHPVRHNWEECLDAEELTKAIENKGLVLVDPINIIQPCESICPEPLVLRKKNLLILKKEVKRAQLANSIDELDEMLDNSNGNTEIKNEENANSSIISNESLSSKEKAIKDSIDSAYLIIKPLGGMLVAEDLLSHEDMQRLINYIESIVRDELLQENLPLFPKIPLSNMFIRKTIHEVYLFLGKKNRDQFIKLTHLFEQFDGTEKTTTNSKFSSYSGIYEDHLMKISY